LVGLRLVEPGALACTWLCALTPLYVLRSLGGPVFSVNYRFWLCFLLGFWFCLILFCYCSATVPLAC